jgi:hypothetical protein
MKMATCLLVLLLGAAGAGCAVPIRPTTITVPNTPDANKCWRECDLTTTTCIGTCRGNLFAYWAVKRCMAACADSRDHCYQTCPGATDAGETASR